MQTKPTYEELELPSDLDPSVIGKFADINSILLKATDQLSELALALRPAMLDDLGLVPTLRWYFKKVEQRTNLKIEYKMEIHPETLDFDITTVLYRITQEALNNITKHADAKKVVINIEQQEDSVNIKIKDDGRGFDVDEILTSQEEGRIGLIGMQERASLMGGNLIIQSSKGHGTIISVEIPLHSKEA